MPDMDPWERAYHEEVERRLLLARRVGFLEGTVKVVCRSLRRGADPQIVADVAEEMMQMKE